MNFTKILSLNLTQQDKLILINQYRSQHNAFKWTSKSKCSVITHSKSWKGSIFKNIFSMNVSKMYKIRQKAQSIVALKRVEHNPHVLLCNKQVQTLGQQTMANKNSSALQKKSL